MALTVNHVGSGRVVKRRSHIRNSCMEQFRMFDRDGTVTRENIGVNGGRALNEREKFINTL